MPTIRKLFGDGGASKAKDGTQLTASAPGRQDVPAAPTPTVDAGSPANPCQQVVPATTLEVIARHAIQGTQVKVTLPRRAKFKHIKQALAKFMGTDEILTRGQLMRKESGIYSAYKDSKQICDVRQVLVVCADFSALGDQCEDMSCSLNEDEVSDADEIISSEGVDPKSIPFTRSRAISLQKELLQGFMDPRFQKELAQLQKRSNGGSLTPMESSKLKQDLLLTVQAKVLPNYGFDGTPNGVLKMLGAMGPFVKDAEFMDLGKHINELIGVESPPSSWGDLAKSCKKLESIPEPEVPKNWKQRWPRNPRFELGFGSGMGAAPPRALIAQAQPESPRYERRPERRRSSWTERQSYGDEDSEGNSLEEAEDEEQSLHFEPWPNGRPHPFRLCVVGTFNMNTPQEMDYDAQSSMFICPLQVGEDGDETFELWINGRHDQVVYPSTYDAWRMTQHEVRLGGPDESKGRRWRLDKERDEHVCPGQKFVVVAGLDKDGKITAVDWQFF